MITSIHMPAFPEPTVPDAPVKDAIMDYAKKAVQAAYAKTKDAGLPVVVASDDTLVRIEADGQKTVLKQLPPKQAPSRRSLTIR